MESQFTTMLLAEKSMSILVYDITKETHIDHGKLFSKKGLKNKSERQSLLIENRRQACIRDVH
jgi:hypothetical protein